MAVPADWAESDPAPASLDLTTYWRLLDDPLVTQFVEAALSQQSRPRAERRAARAGAGAVQRRAGRLLPADFGQRRRAAGFRRPRRPTTTSTSLGADASWELDLFGRIGASVSASEGGARRGRLFARRSSAAGRRTSGAGDDLGAADLAPAGHRARHARLSRRQPGRSPAGACRRAGLEPRRRAGAQPARADRGDDSAARRQPHRDGQRHLHADRRAAGPRAGPAAGFGLRCPTPPEMAGFEAPAEVLRRRPDVRGAEAALVASTARIHGAAGAAAADDPARRHDRHLRRSASATCSTSITGRPVRLGQPADLRRRADPRASRQRRGGGRCVAGRLAAVDPRRARGSRDRRGRPRQVRRARGDPGRGARGGAAIRRCSRAASTRRG